MKYFASLAVTICMTGSAAFAAPVNGTGNITPDTIFGTGNANGSFTGVNQNDVELGLRGKLRYDTNGQPSPTYNYDGNKTYTFLPANSNAPANRSAFNFDWSINVDPFGSSGNALSDLTYLMEIDFDPTVGTSFVSGDPINVAFADHAIGNNSTPNDGGAEAVDAADYLSLISGNNVAQNSSNLGFFGIPGFDPQTEGMFTINLSALHRGQAIASTSIDIVYGNIPAQVPLPASLPLLLAAFGGLGLVARRRRS